MPALLPRSRTLYNLVVVELYLSYTVLGDCLDGHSLEIDRHSPLELVCAQLEQLHALHERDVWVVVFVEDGQAVVLCIAVRGVGQGRQRREVVDPEETGLVGDRVDAAEQQVDVVGLTGS